MMDEFYKLGDLNKLECNPAIHFNRLDCLGCDYYEKCKKDVCTGFLGICKNCEKSGLRICGGGRHV